MARYPNQISAHDGTQYRYHVVRGKYGITQLLLGVDLPDVVRFTLRREWAFDWFGKALGLAREYQCSDEKFDSFVYIQSDDRKLHEVLSLDAELRTAIEALLRVRTVDSIEMEAGVLWIKSSYDRDLYGYKVDREIAGRLAEVVLPLLLPIKTRLARLSGDSWQGERDPYLQRYRIILMGALVLGGIGLLTLSLMPGPELPRALLRPHIHAHAFIAAGIAFAVLLTLTLWLVGRTSRTHRLVAWILFITVPGVWAAASVYYEYLNNAILDHAPPFKSYVVDLHATRGRHHTYYRADLTVMPDKRMDRHLTVNAETFATLNSGECVNLDIRNGALGDPVLTGVSPVPCE